MSKFLMKIVLPLPPENFGVANITNAAAIAARTGGMFADYATTYAATDKASITAGLVNLNGQKRSGYRCGSHSFLLYALKRGKLAANGKWCAPKLPTVRIRPFKKLHRRDDCSALRGVFLLCDDSFTEVAVEAFETLGGRESL